MCPGQQPTSLQEGMSINLSYALQCTLNVVPSALPFPQSFLKTGLWELFPYFQGTEPLHPVTKSGSQRKTNTIWSHIEQTDSCQRGEGLGGWVKKKDEELSKKQKQNRHRQQCDVCQTAGGREQRGIKGDGKRLDFRWWTHNAVCKKVLLSCTLETCVVSLTNFTPINLIKR